MAYDTTTSVTDSVTDNLASYHNQLKTAIDNVMTATAYSSYVRTQSMTANVTLTNSDFPIQSFSPTAARDLTLPTVASTNHTFYVINRSGTYTITIKNAAAATIYSLTINSSVMLVSDGTNNWYAIGGAAAATNTYGNIFGADGVMLNGKLSVTVATNNITVAIKTLAGADPSAGDPVYIRINGTIRTCSAATSVTKNAGTNWANGGAAEFAAKEIDYFAYAIWNTGPATDIIDIGFARIPFGRVYSDFSATTTNEKYLAYGNGTAPASTDDVAVIGRFAATNSGSASYNWSVPTFTNVNLINHPIFETRPLTWQPTYSANGSMTYTTVTTDVAEYRIFGRDLRFEVEAVGTIGGTVNVSVIATLPFTARNGTYLPAFAGWVNTSGSAVGGYCLYSSGAAYFRRYDFGNWTLGASRYINGNGSYMI